MKNIWNLFGDCINIYKKADKIHVLSPNVIESDSILTPHKNKCEIIPYGIDTNIELYEDEVQKIKEQYPNKKIILCCGRLVKLKGFQYVIEAMKDVENAVLLIMGDGPLRNSFVTYIEKNDLKNKVILLGAISDKKQKEIYYLACDIFVLSSIKESFGIVQLEAMKYGKPIINTNLGTGVNFVSINNKTGLTVEPCNVEELAKVINILLTDEELRNKLGQNARKRVEELFDIEKIKDKYIRMYED